MSTALTFIAVFVVMVIIDFVWAKYIKAAADNRRIAAALYSAAIVVFGAFNTWVFIHNPWLVVSEAAGAFVGTWLSVTLDKNK